ncbi:MAG TPA: response regulator, partial [Candidatus Marinimicrobia bacterium]|nr:response regulator [Candidatus Neomarinimicrobiota bacterium]
FNNMLSVIVGSAELVLMDKNISEETKKYLNEILKAAQRSANLTRQLLAFARKQTIKPKELDLNETVEEMLKMLRRLIGEDIDLLWKPSRESCPVKMDPAQIDQILANLCVNARDAINGVGKVTIETKRTSLNEAYCAEHPGFLPGNFVVLTVSDNGCGMDQETQKKLFEPFFTTKEVGKGTGLGLATVYGIIKQNKGFINVYSEPGKGSSFRIYIPKSESEEIKTTLITDDLSKLTGNESILIVEDEPSILAMGKMMLEEFGYKVLTANSPQEAVFLVKNYDGVINLLITDVVMPEMNGRELAKIILKHRPNIKLLFMSGYTANVIAHHGVLDKEVEFIEKPFSLPKLGKKVRAILNGHNKQETGNQEAKK